jgi:hypothetical protein
MGKIVGFIIKQLNPLPCYFPNVITRVGFIYTAASHVLNHIGTFCGMHDYPSSTRRIRLAEPGAIIIEAAIVMYEQLIIGHDLAGSL